MVTIDTVKLILICISIFLSGFSMGMGVTNIIFNSFEKRDKSDKKRNCRDTDRNPRDKF